jgi:hypothetical protein
MTCNIKFMLYKYNLRFSYSFCTKGNAEFGEELRNNISDLHWTVDETHK